jgi:hypothetical protein
VLLNHCAPRSKATHLKDGDASDADGLQGIERNLLVVRHRGTHASSTVVTLNAPGPGKFAST